MTHIDDSENNITNGETALMVHFIHLPQCFYLHSIIVVSVLRDLSLLCTYDLKIVVVKKVVCGKSDTLYYGKFLLNYDTELLRFNNETNTDNLNKSCASLINITL